MNQIRTCQTPSPGTVACLKDSGKKVPYFHALGGELMLELVREAIAHLGFPAGWPEVSIRQTIQLPTILVGNQQKPKPKENQKVENTSLSAVQLKPVGFHSQM